jgi:hypothetical protein
VQVNLGYAAEQAVVKLTQPKSKLVEATMLFPLGLVLESERSRFFCSIMWGLTLSGLPHATACPARLGSLWRPAFSNPIWRQHTCVAITPLPEAWLQHPAHPTCNTLPVLPV